MTQNNWPQNKYFLTSKQHLFMIFLDIPFRFRYIEEEQRRFVVVIW